MDTQLRTPWFTWRIGLPAWCVIAVLIALLILVPHYRRNSAVRELEKLPGVEVHLNPDRVPAWLRNMCRDFFDPVVIVTAPMEMQRGHVERFVAQLRHLPEVEWISAPLADADAQSLQQCPNLRLLEITGPQWTDTGMSELPELPRLTMLNLSRTSITDAALAGIAKRHGLKDLQLSGTAVTSVGVNQLATLKHLQSLQLDNTSVDETAVRKLVEQLPSLNVLDD